MQKRQNWFPALNTMVNVVAVVVVLWGVWVAKETLVSIAESVKVSREQSTATRDARRLEQRAWLGYAGFTLQSKKNTRDVPWEDREMNAAEDIVRFRVSVANSGKTPALNVALDTGAVKLAVLDYPRESDDEPPPTEWLFTQHQRGVVVTAGEQGHYLYTPALPLHPDLVGAYMAEDLRILLWTQLQYCDVYGRRHWALNAVGRQAGSDSQFRITDHRFGPTDGEPDHPYCENVLQETRNTTPL